MTVPLPGSHRAGKGSDQRPTLPRIIGIQPNHPGGARIRVNGARSGPGRPAGHHTDSRNVALNVRRPSEGDCINALLPENCIVVPVCPLIDDRIRDGLRMHRAFAQEEQSSPDGEDLDNGPADFS